MAPAGIAAASSYGGVLLLLRDVAGQLDDAVWTFPKDRDDASETPERAARRAVGEEAGCRGRAGRAACKTQAERGPSQALATRS